MMFIAVEGRDGVGKTYLAHLLYDYLSERGRDVLYLHEPGGGPTSAAVLDNVMSLDAHAGSPEVLYYAHLTGMAGTMVDTVIPALDEGKIVIADRWTPSSIAYRPVSVAERTAYEDAIAAAWVVPDLTLYLPDRRPGYTPDPGDIWEADDGLQRRAEKEYEKIFTRRGWWSMISQDVRRLDAGKKPSIDLDAVGHEIAAELDGLAYSRTP